MPALSHLFSRAIQLSKSGKKADARSLLGYILSQEPHNEAAWLWYADTFENPAERVLALQKLLQINPANRDALGALQRLRHTLPAGAVITPWARRHPGAPQTAPAGVQKTAPGGRAGLARWAVVLIVLGAGLCLAAVLGKGYTEYNRLALDFKQLSDQHVQLGEAYAALQQSFEQLSLAYQDLLGQHQVLAVAHQDLTRQHQALKGQYAALAGQYGALESQHKELTGRYDQLNREYVDLSGRHASLTGQYEKLDREAVKPPYIWIHDREVDLAFYRLDQKLLHWTVPFNALEDALKTGEDLRDYPLKLRLEDKDGNVVARVVDFRKFVDAEVFSGVIPSLYRETNDPDAFVRQAWYIVSQLSHWETEDGEIPRTPLETLLAGGGDCEDLSILFASLIKSAPVDWEVNLVYVDSDNILDPVDINHVIVSVKNGQREYLVETTSTTIMEPYADVYGWYVEIE